MTGKTHNGKKGLATGPNKLHDCKLTMFPLTFQKYISFPFRVGGLGGYLDGSSSTHDDENDDDDDDGDDDDVDVVDDDHDGDDDDVDVDVVDDDHCESGQTMASDRNVR